MSSVSPRKGSVCFKKATTGCLGGSVGLAQVMISWFVGSSPTLGSVLTAQSLEPASNSVSPSLSAAPLLMLCLSISKINKHKKNRTTLRPNNFTIWDLSKGYKNTDLEEYMHPNTYSSTINNSQTMERAQMSTDWWMDKEEVVYINNGILFSHQKEWNLAICNSMDEAGVYNAKQNKSENDKYLMTSLTWNLTNKTNKHRKKEKDKP